MLTGAVDMETDIKENNTEIKRNKGNPAFYKGWRGGPGRPRLTNDQKFIKKTQTQIIEKYLKHEGLGAAGRIVEMSKQARSENVKLTANQDVLNRIGVGVKPAQTIVPIQINIGEDRAEFQ